MNYALDALWWRLTDPDVRALASLLTAPPLWHSGCELPVRELLGEHGFPGLFLWLFIFGGNIVRMEIIRRRYIRRNQVGEEWVAPLANALQNFLIIFLVGALFVGIAFQPFPLAMASIAMAFDTYLSRRRQEQEFRPAKWVLQRKREALAR